VLHTHVCFSEGPPVEASVEQTSSPKWRRHCSFKPTSHWTEIHSETTDFCPSSIKGKKPQPIREGTKPNPNPK